MDQVRGTSLIEVARERPIQELERSRDTARNALKHQMVVIAHQAVRVANHAKVIARLDRCATTATGTATGSKVEIVASSTAFRYMLRQ